MLDMKTLAQTVARGNPDVLGVLVVDADGGVHASESTSPDVMRAAVAMAVPLRELLDRTSTELGCGEHTCTVLEGKDASLALADVDGFRSVVVVGATGAAPGALRADSMWMAERLRDARWAS